jgi:hypothetical protein
MTPNRLDPMCLVPSEGSRTTAASSVGTSSRWRRGRPRRRKAMVGGKIDCMRGRVFRLLGSSIVALVTTVVVLGPSSPAEAQGTPTLSVVPNSGPVGTVVTVTLSQGGICNGVVFQAAGSTNGPGTTLSPGQEVLAGPPEPTLRPAQDLVPSFLGTAPSIPVRPGRYQFAISCQFNFSDVATDLVAPFEVTSAAVNPGRFVAIARTPSGDGYWLAQAGGGVYSFGDAGFHGSLPGVGVVPASPIVGIAATPDGRGYWLVGADGGVFAFGDASFAGSLPALHITPAAPVIGIVPTADGRGYWLGAADGSAGSEFAFGDAPYCSTAGSSPSQPGLTPGALVPPGSIFGSIPEAGIAANPGAVNSLGFEEAMGVGWDLAFPKAGAVCTNPPPPGLSYALIYVPGAGPPNEISSIATSIAGQGPWIVGIDGGVFAPDVDQGAFAEQIPAAPFFGSLPGIGVSPIAPIVGIAATPDGGGYWLLGADGGVFAFGDAGFFGCAAR